MGPLTDAELETIIGIVAADRGDDAMKHGPLLAKLGMMRQAKAMAAGG